LVTVVRPLLLFLWLCHLLLLLLLLRLLGLVLLLPPLPCLQLLPLLAGEGLLHGSLHHLCRACMVCAGRIPHLHHTHKPTGTKGL
jgi:hypothetical protein